MKSVLCEVVSRSKWIYIILSVLLLASLAVDLTGIAPKEVFGDAIFFIPTLIAFAYGILPALLLRFGVIRRSFHWGFATLYVVVAYVGWFVLMTALTGEPYMRPSYMLLLSLLAAWKILRFTSEANDASAKINAPDSSPLSHQVQEWSQVENSAQDSEHASLAPAGWDGQETDLPHVSTSLFRKDKALQGVAFAGSLVCAVLLVTSIGDWHSFVSQTDAVSFLIVVMLPAAFSPLCHLLGLRITGFLLLLPATLVCFVYAAKNELGHGTANLAALSAIVSLSTFIFALAMGRKTTALPRSEMRWQKRKPTAEGLSNPQEKN